MSSPDARVDQIIAVFSQATEANRSTPGRAGNVVELTPELAEEVLVTGDLHGNRTNFDRLCRVADLENHRRRHLVFQEVCHGGPEYPDGGGCMSHTVLEDVARLKLRFPDRVHFLLGNHELAELANLPIQKNRQLLNAAFRLGLQQTYGSAAEQIRSAFSPFLRSCPLAVRLSGGVFISHSVPERVDQRRFDTSIFARPLDDCEYCGRRGVFELLWGRDYRPANARAFAELVGARVLLNGHEPCLDGFRVPNDFQVIVDCCGQAACYLILATDRQWTHPEIVEQIQRLA